MANLYDNFVPTEYVSQYVPAPFEAYSQIGQTQQNKYDQAIDMLNQQQDLLAQLPSRQVDIAGKNAIVSEYLNDALEYINKNQKYNPNMMQEIRARSRKVATDPRIAAISSSLATQKELDAIQKQIIASGNTPYKYHNNWYTKQSVDPTGKLAWEDMDTSDLGIENKFNYYNAASERTKDIKAKLQSMGISIVNQPVSVRDPRTGKASSFPWTFVRTGTKNILDPNSPEISGIIESLKPEFSNSKEGRQFIHSLGPNADIDNELTNLFRSTIKPEYQEQIKYDDIPASMYKLIYGNQGSQQISGVPLFNSMAGIGYNTVPGQANKSVTQKTPIEDITLSFDENNRAKQNADKIWNDWQTGKNLNRPWRALNDDDYQALLQKEKDIIKEVKKDRLINAKQSVFTPQHWTTDKETKDFMLSKVNQLNPYQLRLSNASGENIGMTMQELLGKEINIEDLTDNATFEGFKTAKTPNGYSQTNAEYSFLVPEEIAEKARNKVNSDFFNKHIVQDKNSGLYKVKAISPVWSLYDATSEMGLAKKYNLVDDKDPLAYERMKNLGEIIRKVTQPAIIYNLWENAKSGKLHGDKGKVKVDRDRGTLIYDDQEYQPEEFSIFINLGKIK